MKEEKVTEEKKEMKTNNKGKLSSAEALVSIEMSSKERIVPLRLADSGSTKSLAKKSKIKKIENAIVKEETLCIFRV